MKNVAIFASGNGSNAQRIAEYFKGHPSVNIALILSNKADAYVLKRAESLGIPSVVFSRTDCYDTNDLLETLLDHDIDFIVLAGFMWLVPKNLVMAFPDTIVNIHPALLPKYGGKGMYGNHVHKAVIEAKEKESGITIHKVNEHYDEGNILFQAQCTIAEGDTPEILAQKVAALEHEHYPRIIERCVNNSN